MPQVESYKRTIEQFQKGSYWIWFWALSSALSSAQCSLTGWTGCENKGYVCVAKVQTCNPNSGNKFAILCTTILINYKQEKNSFSKLEVAFTRFCQRVDQSPHFYWNLQIFLHHSPDFRCFEAAIVSYTGIKSFSFLSGVHCILRQKVSTKSWMAAISLSPVCEYYYYFQYLHKGDKTNRKNNLIRLPAIRDLELTLCPIMHSIQERKLKLLMPL